MVLLRGRCGDGLRGIALESRGVLALIRQNRGRDIAAACGQLANVSEPGQVLTPSRGQKPPTP